MFTCHKRLLWHLGLYITHQASLSLGLPRQKYWSRLPFPSPRKRYPPREKISTQELSSRLLHCRQILYCWATGWSVLKSRNITLPTKLRRVKSMVFPAVMYGYESWTTKKADRWSTDAFKLWCWRRLLRVPWTARRSNQSILKEINPEYSLEGLILELKLQYFGHLMQRDNSLEKTLMLRKNESKRRRRWQRMRCWMASPAQWSWVWAN